MDPIIENLGYFFGSMVTLIIGYWRFGRRDKAEIEELRKENSDLRRAKYICENKRRNLKDAFDIVYNQYEQDFKNNPDTISMLRDLKKLVDD